MDKIRIVDIQYLHEQVRRVRSVGKKIVFVSGTFDIIHLGHINLLDRSKHFGDMLIAAVYDDETVSKIKSKNRPIIDQFSRAAIVSSNENVDYVIVVTQDELFSMIEELCPDYMVYGREHNDVDVAAIRKLMSKYGGQCVGMPVTEKISTQIIIDKIIAQHNETFSDNGFFGK